MTRYDGGCFKCGRHIGSFESVLPNGCCVHSIFSGWHFCASCLKKLEGVSILIDVLIKGLQVV